MTNIKTFLKILEKTGYPSPELPTISKLTGYDLNNFLTDLVDEIGDEKTNEFVEKSMEKLYEGTKGIRVDLWNQGEYVYLYIDNAYLELDDQRVIINWTWGDTRLLTSNEDNIDTFETIDEISEKIVMGEWSDFYELINGVKILIREEIYKNCGFEIQFE